MRSGGSNLNLTPPAMAARRGVFRNSWCRRVSRSYRRIGMPQWAGGSCGLVVARRVCRIGGEGRKNDGVMRSRRGELPS